MTVARSIGVLRRAIAKGVARGWSGEARGYIVVTVFNTGAVVACLPTPAFVGVVDEFWGYFCRLKRASIRFSSESNNK